MEASSFYCICYSQPVAEHGNISLAPFASNDTHAVFSSGKDKKECLFYTDGFEE